jgi:hypothetical protein
LPQNAIGTATKPDTICNTASSIPTILKPSASVQGAAAKLKPKLTKKPPPLIAASAGAAQRGNASVTHMVVVIAIVTQEKPFNA